MRIILKFIATLAAWMAGFGFIFLGFEYKFPVLFLVAAVFILLGMIIPNM